MPKTLPIKIGSRTIGGGNQILIQSMTNTKTDNISATIKQIKALEKAGCEIVRVAVPDKKSALSLAKIKQKISIPLVADIHFDYRLALLSIEQGADKIRINPGNLGNRENLKKVVKKAQAKNIPIRIGINAGSLEQTVLKQFQHPNAEALVTSALKNIAILEDLNFKNLVISIKHSNVLEVIKAYALLSTKTKYPLHLGVTEAGTFLSGTIKSSIALSNLLMQGIGDTLRISLSADPVKEIIVAYKILESINLRKRNFEIISCPTCGRTSFNVIQLAEKVEETFNNISPLKKGIKIAIMGCLVNGPGEAREADFGVCGIEKSPNHLMFFKKGKLIKKIPIKDAIKTLRAEISKS